MNDIAVIQVIGKKKQSGFAIVDADLFPFLNSFKWNWGTDGYVQGWTRQDSNGVRRHVIMHKLVNQTPPGRRTDHKNHLLFDNRRSTLRTATGQQNKANSRKPRMPGLTSRFKGVSWRPDTNNWKAHIGFNGRNVSIGYYHTEVEAAHAYNQAAIQYFGEFACLNSIT